MLNMEHYHRLARQAVAEGCVLLENDGTLPLKKGTRIASFGRNQFNYYKSGTGSGGRVNAPYVVSVLDALRASPDYSVDEELCELYRAWDAAQPVAEGGWAKEPWSLEEMPLTEEIVQAAAARTDAAVIHLGRTAGEDRDNHAGEGSYALSASERAMLQLVCRTFAHTVVLLNVGNVIDMAWVKEFAPSAVLYVWQGGQEGGNGVLDVLSGRVSPSGRLTDTIAQSIADHPSTAHFGDPKENVYEEDIYVGYRYFETFAPDKVAYPFGFGLSYTTFRQDVTDFRYDGTAAEVCVTVTNTGVCSGKDAVLLYVQAPQGRLGKPARVLAAFDKTPELAPGESAALTLRCANMDFASYDDSGVTGFPAAYVLEAGAYVFYIGGDVRTASECGRFTLDATVVVRQLSHAMSPVRPFRRLTPGGSQDAPLRSYDLWARIEAQRPDALPYTGDLGYKLADVKSGKISLETFIGQIPEDDLFVLLRGEGMCSPKVTPGTGGAFGGVSPALRHFGIPIACCTDGPSGLRMDVGTPAVSLPNGTCLACTFNEELSTELFACTGLEMRKNRIDILLGPGMNIHRSPLNGRNFEYFSEDPLVTGKMAAAQLRGLHRHGVTGTIKHFAANNQEFRRYHTNHVVSERALREIYLRGFRIACTEGGAFTIMSTYGPVNGLWTAGNFDLLTHILRNEWGYDGLVMTDWWAQANEEGAPGSKQEFAAMVRSQNDLYMVTADAASNTNKDNLSTAIHTHKLTLGEVQRSAANVLRCLLRLPVMDREMGLEAPEYTALQESACVDNLCCQIAEVDLRNTDCLPVDSLCTDRLVRNSYRVLLPQSGCYTLQAELRADTDNPLAQLSVTFLRNGEPQRTVTLTGADRDFRTENIPIRRINGENVQIALLFGESGIRIRRLRMFFTNP